MYGISNQEAVFEISENLKIVTTIKIIITNISINASSGDLKLKNIMDHQKFKNN